MPEPDGPTSTMNSPSATWSSSASTAGSVGARVDPRCAGRTGRQPFDTSAEPVVVPQPRVRRGRRSERVERAQRRTDDRRRIDDAERMRDAELGEPACDRGEQSRVARLHEAAAEHDVGGLVDGSDALERDAHERDDLVREPGDDARRDRVALRLGEDERRELDEAAPRDRAGVHGLGQLERGRKPEVRRHELLERRSRPAPVLTARRRPHGRGADVLAAAPVAADLAERRKAGLAAVGRERRGS